MVPGGSSKSDGRRGWARVSAALSEDHAAGSIGAWWAGMRFPVQDVRFVETRSWKSAVMSFSGRWCRAARHDDGGDVLREEGGFRAAVAVHVDR